MAQADGELLCRRFLVGKIRPHLYGLVRAASSPTPRSGGRSVKLMAASTGNSGGNSRGNSGGKYVVYADGACLGNPGPGGWGVVLAEPASEYRELSGGPFPASTNNKMEITAAAEGLRAVPPGTE